MASIELIDDEAWELLEQLRVGIFTSLRRDGSPISLPVWFAPIERRIYLHGPAASKKFGRVSHDPRVSFLVEDGERWIDLRAVHLEGTARLVGDEPELLNRIKEEMDRRYAALRPRRVSIPNATADRYRGMCALEITPTGRMISWDNSRLAVETDR